jgi:hypothetical protein
MVFSDRKREFKPEGKAKDQKLADEIVARIKHFQELRQTAESALRGIVSVLHSS